jgi:cobalamin biosynthesis protein CbiG
MLREMAVATRRGAEFETTTRRPTHALNAANIPEPAVGCIESLSSGWHRVQIHFRKQLVVEASPKWVCCSIGSRKQL